MKQIISVHQANKWLIQYYLIGVAGFLIYPTRSLFQFLTPFGMVMAAMFIIYFHEPKNLKSWLTFTGIVIISFLVELIGVNTHFIFGNYEYGDTLGTKILGTPLTISLNWLVLLYCIATLARNIRNRWYFSLTGALAMVFFDWLIEPVAFATDMWSWSEGAVPYKNYIDWFILSGFLFLMIRALKVELKNPIAGTMIIMQVVFFLTLNMLIRTPLWIS